MQRSPPVSKRAAVKKTPPKQIRSNNSTPDSLKPIKNREFTGIVAPRSDGYEVLIDEMRITQAKMIKQIESLNKENRKLKLELDCSKNQIQEDKEEHNNEQNTLENNILDMKNKLRRATEDIAVLTAENKQLEEQVELYRLSSLKQQSIIDELNSQLSSLQIIDKPLRFADTKIHLLQEKNKKLLSTVISLRKQQQLSNIELSTQKSANRELTQQLTDALTNEDEDQDTIVHIEDMSSYPEVKKLVEMNARKAKRIESLKSEINFMKQTILEQSEKEKTLIDFIESSNTENQKKLSEMNQRLSEFQNSKISQVSDDSQNAELRKSLDEMKLQLTELRKKSLLEEQQKSQLKTELEKVQSENSDLKEKLKFSSDTSFDSNYSMDPIFEQELQQKTKEISQMKVAINSLTSMLSENEQNLQSQISEKENELQIAQQNIKICQDELNSMKAIQEEQGKSFTKIKENVQVLLDDVQKSFSFASLKVTDDMDSLKDVSKFICTNYNRSKDMVSQLQKENEDLKKELKQSNLKNKELSLTLNDLRSSSELKLQNTMSQQQINEERMKDELQKSHNQISSINELFKQKSIEYEKELATSHLTIDQLEEEKVNMKTKIDDLLDQLSAFQSRQTDFTSSINSLETTYRNKEKSLSDTISQLNDDKSKLKLKEEQLTNRVNSMESAMLDLRNENKKLENKKQKLIVENNELKTALEEFTNENKTTLAEKDQKYYKLKETNSEMENQIKDLKREVKEQRKQFEDLKNQSTLSLQAKSEKINKLRLKLKQLQEAFVNLTKEKDQKERENVELQLQITGQSDTVRRAEEQSQKMTAAKEAGDYVFKSLTKKYQDLQKEYADHLQFVEKSKEDIEEMKKVVDDKEKERIDAVDQMNSTISKMENLQNEKSDIEKENSQLSSDLETANKNNTNLQIERKQNLEKIKELTDSNQELKSQISVLQKQNHELSQNTVLLSVYEKLKNDKDELQKSFNFINDELHTTKSCYEMEDKEYSDYKEQMTKKVASLTSTIEDLNKEIAKIKDENDKAAQLDTQTINKLQDQVDSLREKIEKQTAECSKIDVETKEIRRKSRESVDNIKAKNNELAQAIENKGKLIDELNNKIKELEDDKKDIMSNYDSLNAQKIEVEKQLNTTKSTQQEKYDDYTRKLSSYKQKIKEMEAEKATSERIIRENGLKIDELKSQLRNSVPKEDYNKLQEKIDLLKKEKLLESTVLQKTAFANEFNAEKLKDEFARKEKDYLNQIEQLKQDRDKKAEAAKNLANQVKSLNQELVNATESKVPMCTKAEKDAVSMELKAKVEELALSETKLKNKDQIIQMKEKEIEELNKNIEKLEEQIEEIESNDDQIQELNESISNLTADNKSKDNEIASLTATIRSMNEKLLSKTKDLEQMKSDMNNKNPKVIQLDNISKIAKDIMNIVNSPQFAKQQALQRLSTLQDSISTIFTILGLPSSNIMPPARALSHQQGPIFYIPGDKSIETKEERKIAELIIREFPELGKEVTDSDSLDRQLRMIHSSVNNLKLLLEDRERRIRDMSAIVQSQHNAVIKISKDPEAANLVSQSIMNSSVAKDLDDF